MTDAKPNTPEFTVSELSYSLKKTVEDAYGLVRVRGEIGGYRGPHSSGHAYFALKDEGAKIDAVVWRGVFSKLRFKPEEGLEVIATGKLTTYPGKSAYQIVIEALEPAGAGALMALLEERRKRLAAEGLFDAGRKRRIPYLPKVVGVITSPTGAVIRDILHRLEDRFPVSVLVWPVRVQGETSAREVADAITGFDTFPIFDEDGVELPRPDVLIVARGGGSLEDLWGFNEEIVVRAAAACRIPLVSAVGHETDWTLIDHVADLRAPTPTGAAEMVLPVRAELVAEVESLGARLVGASLRGLERRRQELRSAGRALPRPRDLLNLARQRLDLAASRLAGALGQATQAARARYARASGTLSPAILTRATALGRERTGSLGARLTQGLGRTLDRRRALVASASSGLSPERLAVRLARSGERADALAQRLATAFPRALERKVASFAQAARVLASLSYKSVLARGFVVVRDAEGRPVDGAEALRPGAAVALEFKNDVVVGARIEGEPAARPDAPSPPPAGAPRKPKPAPGASGQGDLF